MESLKYTPFNNIHKSLGAKLVPFFGWEMPVQYKSIVEEHLAVRNSCGLFDVSHMGEITVSGQNASNEVQKLITNDLNKINDWEALYSPMCYEHGGIVDDIIVYRFSDTKYMLAVNASNVEKDFNWVKRNTHGVEVVNISDDYAELAIQGPKAQEILQNITVCELNKIGSFCFELGKVADIDSIISRTGYTGEDGFEIYFSPQHAEKVWNAIMASGKQFGITPAGLGARDTLRLEAGLMLYGNDIDENTTPLEATLKWTVSTGKQFIGKDSLINNKPMKKLVGFELIERSVPRHGNEVYIDGVLKGVVTSGTFSPTFKKSIGLCYVPPDHPNIKQINIKIHDKMYETIIKSTRFYRRK